MEKEKVLVHAIDGTDVWIPISAKKLDSNRFEILNDNEFDHTDTGTLFEFIPGDVIELDTHKFKNNTIKQVAKKLISRTKRKDKDYFEFQFNCVQGKVVASTDTMNKYNEVIERINKELKDGQFFYPQVINQIKELQRIMNK